jgi:small subunit ribosomal protein S4
MLKGQRCYTEKCALERKAYPPGQRGRFTRRKVSDYAIRLRSKQKLRRSYGILERQFRRYFRMAELAGGVTSENLLQTLERRLDNVVYRLGLAPSRQSARQLVRHGFFTVNSRKVNIPSYLVKVGDEVQMKERGRKLDIVKAGQERAAKGEPVGWLEFKAAEYAGVMKSIPSRDELPTEFEEQLVVEYYSR